MQNEAAGAVKGGDTYPNKDRLVRTAMSLKRQREPYNPEFRELQQHFLPRRGNFAPDNPGRQRRTTVPRDHTILNSRPRLALRTLQSGMQAGMTSPARPWFRLQAREESIRSRYGVRTFLASAEGTLRQMLQSSGVYNSLHIGYGDVGLLGTDCAIFEADTVKGFTLHQIPPGMFWLGANGANIVDTMYMEDYLTVEQIVGRFVYDNIPTSVPDWTAASLTVRRLWDNGNRGELIRVSRLVAPRYERDPQKYTADNKPICSIWWEQGDGGKQVLRNSGYDRNPIIASRWFREGSEVWGYGPGMDGLGDAKMLQGMERDKNEAIRRMIRPAMNAPTSLRNAPFSVAPGALNFTDDANGLRPVYEVSPPIDQMRVDIREVEERLNEAMYVNLFMMMAASDRRQITAREIEERHEEKLIGLGPVVELQHLEKLGPLVRMAYEAAFAQGRLPEPPEELNGDSLEVDYISMLAQAQKAVMVGSVERFLGFAGNLAGVMPDVLDKIDGDAAMDEYADIVGVAPRILRDQKDVDAIREARDGQQQAAQNAELAATAGPGVKAGVEAATLLAQAPQPRGQDPGDILRRIGMGG